MPTCLARARLAFVLVSAVVTARCGSGFANEPTPRSADPDATSARTPLAIVGVNVLPMTSDITTGDQTIVVRDGRIEALGPSATTRVPDGAVVIDGGGRWVMPALIDMHVHLLRADLEAYVNAGIGTVRNMWGTPGVATLQREIAAGMTIGPTVGSASPGVDGEPPQWPGTLVVTVPNGARDVVRAQAAAGWAYLKVYSRLAPDVFDSAMAAARDAGMTPIGHVPLAVDVHHAIDEGMRSIEHLTGYDRAVSRTHRSGTWGWTDADATRFAGLVEYTVRAGVWNCPTLAIYATLASQQHPAAERELIARNRRQFVRDLSRAGAKLIAGTDAGIDVVAPGTSMHDELAEFVAAGLTRFDALRAATTSAAEFLGRPDLGRVEVGARADLVLLERNPLADIRNTRGIHGVVLGGAWRPVRH